MFLLHLLELDILGLLTLGLGTALVGLTLRLTLGLLLGVDVLRGSLPSGVQLGNGGIDGGQILVLVGLLLCFSKLGGNTKQDYKMATLTFFALCGIAFIFPFPYNPLIWDQKQKCRPSGRQI